MAVNRSRGDLMFAGIFDCAATPDVQSDTEPPQHFPRHLPLISIPTVLTDQLHFWAH